jgi:hypothetical protein
MFTKYLAYYFLVCLVLMLSSETSARSISDSDLSSSDDNSTAGSGSGDFDGSNNVSSEEEPSKPLLGDGCPTPRADRYHPDNHYNVWQTGYSWFSYRSGLHLALIFTADDGYGNEYGPFPINVTDINLKLIRESSALGGTDQVVRQMQFDLSQLLNTTYYYGSYFETEVDEEIGFFWGYMPVVETHLAWIWSPEGDAEPGNYYTEVQHICGNESSEFLRTRSHDWEND